jgi:hypothetical protein
MGIVTGDNKNNLEGSDCMGYYVFLLYCQHI